MVRRILFLLAILLSGVQAKLYSQVPVAAFSMSAQTGCAPLSINFTNSSTGATSYQWNFGNGNFSSLANPQNVYIQPGTYNVSLIAISSVARDTAYAVVSVTAGPQLNISVNSYQGCNDVTSFQFICASNDVANLSWDFGDGTSSTLLNPSKVYSNPGNYQVSLLATNTAGCQSFATLPQQIQTIEPPVAGFTTNSMETCDPLFEFDFVSNSTGGDNYNWIFGDGTNSAEISPTHVFDTSGVFNVTLALSNAFGCTDTFSIPGITVHPDNTPHITASVTNGCLPLASTLSCDVVGAASYSWVSSDGQTASTPTFTVTYFPAGLYDITLHVEMADGCSFDSEQPTTIQVNPKPTAAFTATNTLGCAPLHVQLQNNSVGATNYYWTFGDGGYSFDAVPQYAYQDAGVYTITLKAYNEFGCWRQVTLDSIIVTAPTIDAEMTHFTGCPPLSIELSNLTENAVSYLWDFGDGTTSTDSIPQHTYANLGVYPVTLIAFGSGGCTDTLALGNANVTAQQANYPVPPPLVGCAPFTTTFGLNDPYITSFLWDFGDGSTSTESNPVHVYTEPGQYTVSLQINDGSVCGLAYDEYQQITVEGLIPEFEVSIDPCPPYAVHFTDTTSDAVSWLWDFGDGTFSNLQNPVHIYPNTNNYHVGLSIVTSAGCERTFVGFNAVTFSNNEPYFYTTYDPNASFPSTVSFEAGNIPGAQSWNWDFGDGSSGSGQNTTHTYLVDNEYSVNLTVSFADCDITVTGEAFSTPSEPVGSGTGGTEPPITTIPAEPFVSCAPASASFFPQSPDHQIIEWDFGDGTTSTQSNPVKIYTQPGIYSVSYTANTPQGIQEITYPTSVMIGGFLPEMLVSTDSDCDNFYMQTDLSDPALFSDVHWTFGTSAPQSGVQVSWQVPLTNSSINITVSARDSLGCYTVRNENVLMDKPMPFVSYPEIVCRDAIYFEQLAGTGGLSFFWEFGDGETSYEASPVHQYDSTGAYVVHLTITTEEGCEERHTLSPQIIFAAPRMDVEVTGTWDGCVPHELEINFPGALSYVNYSFGDSLLSNQDLVHLSFPDTGTYSGLTMVATTTWINGCRDTLNFDPIHVYGAYADFSFEQDSHCFPVSAQFTDESPDVQFWSWDFGNGYNSAEQNPLVVFTASPEDTFILAIETIHGCRDTVSKAGLEIFEVNHDLSFSGACLPLTVDFNVSSEEPATFTWNLGNGEVLNQSQISYTYTEEGAYSPFVVGVSAAGCADTSFITTPIDVTSITAAFSTPSAAACAPSIIQFNDLTVGAVAWEWDFGDFSGSTLQNPLKLYNQPGEYTVSLIATSAYGCKDTLIIPEFISVLGPGTSFTISPAGGACAGTPVQFTDLSSGAVEWEWNFGEGSYTDEQNPVFIYNEPGNYVITLFARDTLGCSAFYSIPAAFTVMERPHAGFSIDVDSACTPYTPVITNLTADATEYSWNFGDGSPFLNNFEPTHTYNIAGDYFIELIARNQLGCYDTSRIEPVKSLLVPKALLSINEVSGCIPLEVQFHNACLDLEYPDFQLFFSDTVLQTNPDSIYTFTAPGFYSVELIVTNLNGCADTIYYPHAIQVFDVFPPNVSEVLRVSVEGSETTLLEWNQNMDEQFAYYEIYRRSNQTGAFQLIETVENQQITSFSDPNVDVQDSVYCYKVNVVDVCGRGTEPDSLTEHCTINVEAYANLDNSVEVDWTPYVGRVPGQYVIYRQEENTGSAVDIAVVPGDSLHYSDKSVYCPAKYTYSVKAIELDGQLHLESDSDEELVFPDQNPFLHQYVNILRSTVINNEFVLTEWLPPDTLTQGIVGYAVFRSEEDGAFDWIENLPASQTVYMDSLADLQHIKYHYQIFALNSCGIESGAGMQGDNIVLRVEKFSDLMNKLIWTPYTSWGEEGPAFYNIEIQQPDGSWRVLKTVTGNVTEYLDEGF
ncbi:MAG: PKD domain-containing protein [Bacteroidia bacterium]